MKSQTDERGIDEEIDAIRDDIKELRSDLKGLIDVFRSRTSLRAAGERIADAARERIERLRELAERGATRTRKALSDAKDTGAKMIEEAQTHIAEKPLTSVFTALAVGYIIGRCLRRR